MHLQASSGDAPMDLISTDVVIVGAGGAGIRAAIAAVEADPSLRVALLSKVYPMRSHTVSAEGGAAAVDQAQRQPRRPRLRHHLRRRLAVLTRTPSSCSSTKRRARCSRLEHWGCPWSREPDGQVAVRPFGGMKIERTWFAADKTGFHMLHTLFQTSLKYQHRSPATTSGSPPTCWSRTAAAGRRAIELRTGQCRAHSTARR